MGDFNLYADHRLVQSVVPNGCIELIIHLTGDHCELVKGNGRERSPEFTLIGLQTRAYEVCFHQRVQVFGIRFYPEGIYQLFGVPPAHFTATFENSHHVLGKAFDECCCRLRTAGTVAEKLAIAEDYLLKKLAARNHRGNYLRLAPEIIRQCQGAISLESLVQQVNISPRQLQREFKKTYGITAKEYMRLSRLNAIQQYMQSGKVDLTDLSYEKGFADQSHFIREFKQFTGINPRGFLKEREHFIVNLVD